jgi:hypothetical protein
VTVKTGWFGTSESIDPLNAASIDGGTIRDAPTGGQPAPAEAHRVGGSTP